MPGQEISAIEKVTNLIKEYKVKFIDLQFTDVKGKSQHITISVSHFDEEFFQEGKMFDGSSIKGFKAIHESDMLLVPDPTTAVLDPFYTEPTLTMQCTVLEPKTRKPYNRCPRALAQRAEAYLIKTGIADKSLFGPEPEFFIFDKAHWKVSMEHTFYEIDSYEGSWNSCKDLPEGNSGHRPTVKGGYFPVPPVDSSQDIRSAMCLTLEEMGIMVEAHHHEVATANQNEISTKFNSLMCKADEMQLYKYVVLNTAHQYGKTATFMPKPLVGDNGNGMHCHQSLIKNGVNIFAGNNYAGLSDIALYYIGGIIKHAKALNAFTNPTTNSYKRLVPGFEAPVLLAYSSLNRSAAIRIPAVNNPKGTRIEVRFPDACANPYYAFAAMMMAGLDGIRNKIHPGDPMDTDLYDLPAEVRRGVPQVCFSLYEALDALDKDREFLLQGDVFSDDLIDTYIKLKHEEANRVNMWTHPIEFDMYYSS